MSLPPALTTPRLTLRAFGEDDIEALASLFEDRSAMWDVLSIPGMPETAREVAARRIADSIHGWNDHGAGFWAVEIRGTGLGPEGRLLGYCGFVNPAKGELEPDNDAVEVGWAIHPDYQRRGLASEAMTAVLDYAFERRAWRRLVAITDPGNRASRALMTRLGFVFDADIHAYGVAQVRYVLDRQAFRRAATGEEECR